VIRVLAFISIIQSTVLIFIFVVMRMAMQYQSSAFYSQNYIHG
jgi:hypothetical protein